MAKLFQVTEESIDSVVHATPIAKLYNPFVIINAIEQGGKANIKLESRIDDGIPTLRVVSEDLATVTTAANGLEANTNVLNLSVVNDYETPAADFVAYNKLFNVFEIIEVFADPTNAAQSVVVYEEERNARPTK